MTRQKSAYLGSACGAFEFQTPTGVCKGACGARSRIGALRLRVWVSSLVISASRFRASRNLCVCAAQGLRIGNELLAWGLKHAANRTPLQSGDSRLCVVLGSAHSDGQ